MERIPDPTSQPRVLVVNGWGDWAGVLRLPNLLRRAGCHVSVFAEPTSKLLRSRFIDEHIAAPRGDDAFLNALGRHLTAGDVQYTWVVLGNEPTLDAVARRRSEPWVQSIFPVELTDYKLDVIANKATFTEACDALGVRVPQSFQCQTLEELRSAATSIGLPVIIKPCHGWAGDGVRAIRDESEIDSAFDQVKSRAPLIVQRFLDGQVGSTQFLLDHGMPVCWFNSFKSQCWPKPFGPSCAREMFEDPQIEPMLRSIGQITTFHGLCGIDWIRTDDGVIHLLEFNPRPTPALEAARFVGVDFARSIAAMLAGVCCTQRPRVRRRTMVYMFPQHPTRCLMEHDLADLLHWLPFAGKHCVAWEEPRILMGDLRVLLRQASVLVKSDARRAIATLRNWVKQGVRSRPTLAPEPAQAG